MKTKICKQCKEEKNISEFYKSATSVLGVNSLCKKCYYKKYQENNKKLKKYRKQYFKKNKEKIRKYRVLYKIKNRDKLSKKDKEYRLKNKERIESWTIKNRDKILKKKKTYRDKNKEKLQKVTKEWMLKNKEKVQAYKKEYAVKNKDKINKYKKEYHKKRRNRDIGFKVKGNLSCRMRMAIKNKSDSTINLIGCSIDYLMYHLQEQFTKGMSWDNYGKGGWSIDHVKPCVSFDLRKPSQQQKCFNYSNLQPLWEIDNLIKGSK